MRKKITTGRLVDDPEIEPVARVGTYIGITDKKLGRLIEPGRDSHVHPVEMGGVDGLVEVVPIDLGSRHLIFDDIAVFGAAPGERARADDQRPGIVAYAFFTAQTMTGELVRRQLVIGGIGGTQTETTKTVRRKSSDRRWHKQPFVCCKAKINIFISKPSGGLQI